MSLSAQQNDALKFQLAQLLDYDASSLAKAVKRVAEELELEARHITDTQQPAI